MTTWGRGVLAVGMAAFMIASASMLAGVDGGRGAGRVLAVVVAPAADEAHAVNGSGPLVPPVTVRLSGDVTGLAADTGALSVTVHVGGRSIPAAVSGTRFQAELTAETGDMVAVEARAERVHYRTLLGSAAILKRRAGADGVLEQSELRGLRISPMSTAIAFLTRRALGDRDPRSDIELRQARRSLASDNGWTVFDSTVTEGDLAAAAFVLEEVSLGRVTLPPGMSNGLQLIADANAYATALKAAGGHEAAFGAPFRDGVHAPLASLSELPAQLLLTTQLTYADPSVGASDTLLLTRVGPDRYRVEFSQLLEPQPGEVPAPYTQPEYTVSLIEDGNVALTPVEPLVVDVVAENGLTRIEMPRSIVLRRLTDSGGSNLWATEMHWYEHFLERERLPRERLMVTTWWGIEPGAVAQPIEWAAGGRRVMLPHLCMRASTVYPDRQSLTTCEYAQHRFDAGGTGVTEDVGTKIDANMKPRPGGFGAPFTWRLHDDGRRLRIEAGNVTVDYWLIDTRDAIGQLVFYRAFNHAGPDIGQVVADVVMAVPGAGLPFDGAQATGSFRLPDGKLGLSYPDLYAPGYLIRHANGTADEYLDRDGLSGPSVLSTWAVAGERLYDTRYRARFNGVPKWVYSCDAAFDAGASDCAPWRVRFFRPIARAGARLYGYTEFYFQSSYYPRGHVGPYTFTRGGGGPVFYDCTAGGCTGNTPGQ